LRVSDRDRALIGMLIEALDEDGFLGQPLEEIFEMLPEELEIEMDDLEVALRLLQACDPPGIGRARPGRNASLQLLTEPQSRCRDLRGQ